MQTQESQIITDTRTLCVCVCVCMRACVCVCVCVFLCARQQPVRDIFVFNAFELFCTIFVDESSKAREVSFSLRRSGTKRFTLKNHLNKILKKKDTSLVSECRKPAAGARYLFFSMLF